MASSQKNKKADVTSSFDFNCCANFMSSFLTGCEASKKDRLGIWDAPDYRGREEPGLGSSQRSAQR